MAPPVRGVRAPAASFLPPPPTVLSSRVRVEREPEITSRYSRTVESDDDYQFEDRDRNRYDAETDNNAVDYPEFDERDDEQSPTRHVVAVARQGSAASVVRYGPPKGRPRQTMQPIYTAGDEGSATTRPRQDESVFQRNVPMSVDGNYFSIYCYVICLQFCIISLRG